MHELISLRSKKFIAENIQFFGALFYAFLIPFNQIAATLAMGLWLLLSIVFGFKKNKGYNNKIVLIPILLYISYLFSLSYNTFSTKILQHNLSLLVFPLIFFLNRFTNRQKQSIYRALIYGLFLASITCLCLAAYNSLYVENGTLSFSANVLEGRGFKESIVFGGNYFFGNSFSYFHQTVYFSLYLCAGISVLFFAKTGIGNVKKLGYIFFFTFSIFLISNKAGFLVLLILFFLKLIDLKIDFFKKVIVGACLFIAASVLVYNNPRTLGSLKKLKNVGLTIDKKARYDYKTRLLSWDAAVHLIKTNPIRGYGPEETQTELNKVYKEKEYIFPLKNSYNAHNQFLQIWLENGIQGIILFITILGFLLKRAIKDKNQRMFYVASFLFLFVNALFESYFNRFSGISFFSFWWCILMSDFYESEA